MISGKCISFEKYIIKYNRYITICNFVFFTLYFRVDLLIYLKKIKKNYNKKNFHWSKVIAYYVRNKIDRFIRVYDKTRYLVLVDLEKCNGNYNKIRYLVSQKSGIPYVFSNHYAKINVDSYDSLPIEKALTLDNVIIHTKSVLKKDQNHYCHDILLEKYLYQFAKKL